MTSRWTQHTLALAVLLGAASAQREAVACGGLFCSASAPVNQTAERIVFAKNDDGTIDAIIEIQYQGPSEKFAWLLPMPGVPDVGVSAKAALDAIDNATAPSYTLEYEYGGQCTFPEFAVDSPTAGSPVDEDDGGGITVLDQGTAGPYDYVIINADPELDDAAQVAVDWLVDAGYDVSDIGADVLRPYLEQELNLVAFRLTKGNDTGAIVPVLLSYEGEVPSIPIGPTAVAANPDMGVRVFLLGEERSVSDNYLSLELNESRINWFDWRSNYDEVVSAAADEAGGHGFVTEYAGSTEPLDQRIWDPYTAERWQALQTFEGSGVELLMEARWPFGAYEGFRRGVEAATTLPDGVTIDEFASDPFAYEGSAEVDSELFLQTLDTEIVRPLQQAQELVDSYPYLSRLYTTLSPDEMIVDPSFVFNSDLPEISNVHTAQITVECGPEYPYPWDAPWTITLPDGNTISGVGQAGWLGAAEDLPAVARASQVSDQDEGTVVLDNRALIEAALDDMAVSMPNEPTTDTDGGATETDEDGTDPEETDVAQETDATDPPATDTDTTTPGEDDETDDAPAPGDDSTSDDAPSSDNDDGCAVAAVGGGSAPLGGLALVSLLGAAALRRRRR